MLGNMAQYQPVTASIAKGQTTSLLYLKTVLKLRYQTIHHTLNTLLVNFRLQFKVFKNKVFQCILYGMSQQENADIEVDT